MVYQYNITVKKVRCSWRLDDRLDESLKKSKYDTFVNFKARGINDYYQWEYIGNYIHFDLQLVDLYY